MYDASASDQNSGISVEAKHYDNDQEAIRHAVEKIGRASCRERV